MSMIPECLRKLGVRELSEEEYKEYCKIDPEWDYAEGSESENEDNSEE